jgi:hypothetical protein
MVIPKLGQAFSFAPDFIGQVESQACRQSAEDEAQNAKRQFPLQIFMLSQRISHFVLSFDRAKSKG